LEEEEEEEEPQPVKVSLQKNCCAQGWQASKSP